MASLKNKVTALAHTSPCSLCSHSNRVAYTSASSFCWVHTTIGVISQYCRLQITDKLVEKIGVQRTPGANPEMYKSDDYSVHLKGDNQTPMQEEREVAGQSCLQL